ncbi:MAG: bifunctional diaminohydroxyphosphoribosylaminopyrimidine deaminase/5-amino-6-(5-phosphoribosylamino)uracil reductase RibD [Planctomycetes bacterium]|nr:bifunctional diaminohydroxyphosphoribosylaminopyrimidine deaminase/5-amino-6-(5-phosphoribosylamino)uracil reductase RibD [Planctomycetota bacterium]
MINDDGREKWMSMALDLAIRGRGMVEPNPMVGAVLVKDNVVVGVGWHQKFGGLHAEAEALNQAGENARGCTLFVSLEPCSHHGKTPPCADALVKSGISKVVVAMRDPNPLVAGKGINYLKDHGVEVVLGVGKEKAEIINAPFIKYYLHSKPFVIAKWAMSLDGKIATKTGESKWISNERCREKVHQLRGLVDAVLVGIGTIQNDDPMLNARPEGPRKQIRVVIDPNARISLSSRIIQSAKEFPTIIAVKQHVSQHIKVALRYSGCELLELSSCSRVDIVNEVLDFLGKKSVQNLLVEGGGITLGSFFDASQVDEIAVYIAPVIIGGTDAISPVGGGGALDIAGSQRLGSFTNEMIGDNILLSGRLKHYHS